jgi:hypothetical protein
MGFSRQTLIKTNINAIEAAWCSEKDKKRLKKIILSYARQKGVDGLGEIILSDAGDDHSRSWRRSKTESFSDRVYMNANEYM